MSDRQSLPTRLSRIASNVSETVVRTIVAGANSQLTQVAKANVPELRIRERGEKTARKRPLAAERYSIGRSSQCDIVLGSPLVGREHVTLQRHPRHRRCFILQDTGSRNGTYKNGRPIAAGRNITMRSGDRITLAPPHLADSVRLQLWAPPPWPLQILRWGVLGTTVAGGLLVGAVGLEWQKFPNRLPSRGPGGPTIVYSRDGQPLRSIQTRPYRALSLEEFSPYLPAAAVASEDSQFYWHFGFDPKGIARALVTRFRGGPIQGASTITQQLARTIYPDYVGRDNSIGRKLRELAVALKLETLYSKERILQEYLNRVYLGDSHNGFEAAARFYFEKSAADLTLSEAATLVAILPAPNDFNPVRDYETAIRLRNRVLERMEDLGSIDATAANQARRSPIIVSESARQSFFQTRAPYFHDRVWRELGELLTPEVAAEGNFIIETGLDLALQAQAEAALRQAISTQGQRFGFTQGAIVTLDGSTGEVLALVGGAGYQDSQFDRATQAQRQPGSTFKLFAYAAALEAGIPVTQTYSCAPLAWQGQQYRGCERAGGQSAVDMYWGMVQSENAVALRIARDVGLRQVVQTARSLGIRSELQAVPGLVLGQSETNVLEMTGA
ncbi:MAG: transglycosylase domain-containing protein, partial [Cyanobacteria bacterium J06641_5]